METRLSTCFNGNILEKAFPNTKDHTFGSLNQQG